MNIKQAVEKILGKEKSDFLIKDFGIDFAVKEALKKSPAEKDFSPALDMLECHINHGEMVTFKYASIFNKIISGLGIIFAILIIATIFIKIMR